MNFLLLSDPSFLPSSAALSTLLLSSSRHLLSQRLVGARLTPSLSLIAFLVSWTVQWEREKNVKRDKGTGVLVMGDERMSEMEKREREREKTDWSEREGVRQR